MPLNLFLTFHLRLNILSRSVDSTNNEANLALACRSCNLRKGIRISGISPDGCTETGFFHPRQNQWSEHFQVDIDSGMIVGISSIGQVTVENLEMNSPTQVAARQLWIRLDLFS